MVKELQYTSIKRVLDNLTDHPLMRDLTLEQVVRHTIRFIGKHGYPKLYQDKIDTVDIKDFRGELPCDLVSIIQVKDLRTGFCLRSMTDNFTPGQEPACLHRKHPHHRHPKEDGMEVVGEYIPAMDPLYSEPAFKTQGRIIYTSFPEGCVEIAYKSIPVDEDGFPLLLDNENYLEALEAYIKKQVFTVKFETGKIAAGVLQNAQKEYAWAAGQLNSEMLAPSLSEMESLSRTINTLIPRVRHFDNGFRNLSDREYIRNHSNRS